MKLLLRLLTLQIFICMTPIASAFNTDVPFIFEHLGMKQGLSLDTALAVHQDSSGFLWIATENGLNRYDGHTIKIYYRSHQHAHSLPSDYLWTIQEDVNHDLWFYSNEGELINWRRQTDTFRTLEFSSTDSAVASKISALIASKKGPLWIGTRQDGLHAISLAGAPLAHFGQADGLRSNRIHVLTEDSQGGIWIGSDAGLDYINGETGKIHSDLSLPAKAVSALFVSAENEIWVALRGAGLFYRAGTQAEFVPVKIPTAYASKSINSIMQDSANRIWLGTENGVLVKAPDSDNWRSVQHDAADPYSLATNIVTTLAEDRNGLIWVATRGGGLSRWNPHSLSLGPHTPAELSGAHINAFCDGPNNELWIGTFGDGLWRATGSGQIIAPLSSNEHAPKLSDNRVMSLLSHSDGAIWIGTLGGGINRLIPSSGKLQIINDKGINTPKLPTNGVMSLLEDKHGNVWAGLFNGGVVRLNSQASRLWHLSDPEHPEISKVRATALAEGPNNEIWIGTEDQGLYLYHSGKLTQFPPGSALGELLSKTVFSLLLDAEANVWLGTSGHGLARLSRQSLQLGLPEFVHWTSADGLSGNSIYGIEQADDQELWLSSNRGLMRFSPHSSAVRAFYREHGLAAEEFNFGAHLRSQSGKMLFGVTSGFNVIDPSLAAPSSSSPRLTLTKVETFNQQAELGAPAYAVDALTFTHKDSVFTLEYALLDFVAPDNNLYSVKMDGFNDRWSDPRPLHRTTFTNLDPGHYRFRVRAWNSNGVKTAEELVIPIEVLPAPWATWWAYILYATAFAGVLGFILRWVYREQERQARLNNLVYFDQVTGLPNRELFDTRAEEALIRCHQESSSLAVLSIRVAIPNVVKDTMGSYAHSDILRALSSAFVQASQTQELESGHISLARLEGDEFAAFVWSHHSIAAAEQFARRLLDCTTQPINVGEHRIPIQTAIGIAAFPVHAKDVESLLKFATAAANDYLHSFQRSGLAIYDSDMTMRATNRLTMEGRLRQAIANDELELFFQPVFDQAGQLVAAEALLRWNDADLGFVPPDEFVRLAEASQLIFALDSWVFNTATRHIQAWDSAGLSPIRVALNVSAHNLSERGIVKNLLNACRANNIAPQRIELEITESALLNEAQSTKEVLLALKSEGFSLALDDFGTGYSSLTHLHELDIDTVKIDRGFVHGLDRDERKEQICGAIIALAKGLRMHIVAEGIETDLQYQRLLEMGCELFQGYFLGRPVPAAEVPTLLQQH